MERLLFEESRGQQEELDSEMYTGSTVLIMRKRKQSTRGFDSPKEADTAQLLSSLIGFGSQASRSRKVKLSGTDLRQERERKFSKCEKRFGKRNREIIMNEGWP